MINALVRLVLPDVQDLLREGSPEDIRKALEPFHAADVAELLEQLEDPDAARLVDALELQRRVEVFGQLETDACVRLVELLGPEKVATTVARMASDDRADLMGELPTELGQRLLAALPPEERRDVARLVTYPDGTAGAIMTSDYVSLTLDETARDAIEHIRQVARRRETIYALYVVDAEGRLQGACSLETLILSAPDKKVRELMFPPISVKVDTDQEDVVGTLSHYDFLAVPVVDDDGIMLGIVTHDDVLDVAEEEATEDFQRVGAVGPIHESLLEVGAWVLYKKRIAWLVALVFVNLLSGAGMAYYEDTISHTVALVFFLPLLIGSAGNAGSQAATLTIRAMATGDVNLRDWLVLMRKELLVATTLGATMAAAVSFVGVYRGGLGVGFVVAATMVLVVCVGSLVGLSLPFLLSRLGMDPAAASVPLVTSIADITGVLIYFTIATWVLIG
ncbi:MAG: magnesium transporter [Planctomycetes bacterium]|nr:magnesium transporter [Planctomycetota bacterium]